MWTNKDSLSAGHCTWLPVRVLILPLCEAWGHPFSFLGLSVPICKMAELLEEILRSLSTLVM